MTQDIDDPLEKIFEKTQPNRDNSLKLFEEDDITLKTQVSSPELVLVNALTVENELIKKLFPKDDFDLYGHFLKEFKRHKVSLDRQSRQEFVNVNMRNMLDRDIQRASNIKNLVEARS